MQVLKVKLTGKTTLLMHSDKGADVLDPAVKAHKALTGKRKKTDEDQIAIARSEFELAFYLDKKGTVSMPTRNIWSAMVNGGKLVKLGTALQRGTLVMTEFEELVYDGPKTVEGLWKTGKEGHVDARGVVVGGSRVIRYRPKFPEWSVTTEIHYDPSQIDEREIMLSLQNAGNFVGLGDFRPKCNGTFGRFTVEKI